MARAAITLVLFLTAAACADRIEKQEWSGIGTQSDHGIWFKADDGETGKVEKLCSSQGKLPSRLLIGDSAFMTFEARRVRRPSDTGLPYDCTLDVISVSRWSGCNRKPAEFLEAAEWWKSLGPAVPVDLPAKNVIKVTKSGDITWNEASLDNLHGPLDSLRSYLAVSAEMQPQPLIFLDAEPGAPCRTIIRVRELMLKHLDCRKSKKCLQGPAPY